MRPKSEWFLNAAFIVLFLIIGAGISLLTQFPLGSIVLGLLFYGGIATLLISVWREQKHEKPRRANAKRGFVRTISAGVGVAGATLIVLCLGAYLFS